MISWRLDARCTLAPPQARCIFGTAVIGFILRLRHQLPSLTSRDRLLLTSGAGARSSSETPALRVRSPYRRQSAARSWLDRSRSPFAAVATQSSWRTAGIVYTAIRLALL